MHTGVPLDEFPAATAPRPPYMHLADLPRLRLPDPLTNHHLAQRLPAYGDAKVFQQILGCQRGTEIAIIRLYGIHRFHHCFLLQSPVRAASSESVYYCAIALLPKPPQQLTESPLAHAQLPGSLPLLQMPLFHFVQYLQPVPLSLAQCHSLLFFCQPSLAHPKTGTFYFALLGTSHIAPTFCARAGGWLQWVGYNKETSASARIRW